MIGITPAYAGNTAPRLTLYIYARDHPRLRGEHVAKKALTCPLVGSPPPTRGTRFMEHWKDKEAGITPAYAGNTKKFVVFLL